jgi:hypothetical protein
MMRKAKPTDHEAQQEREQIQRIYAAMKAELSQLEHRADLVLERLRAKAARQSPPLRLVKSR